jgi:hypothetical protein
VLGAAGAHVPRDADAKEEAGMNERKLTRLEAAMLGLYLLGYRFVYKDCAKNGYITAAPTIDYDRSWQPFFHIGDTELHQIVEITPDNETFDLLPWLIAHNVPIPEVEP